MHGANEHPQVDDAGRSSYDMRLRAVEMDVAVIRTSFATKDDIQTLRAEMHAGHERILTLLYEHKLEFQAAMAKQREEFLLALGQQREDFHAALAEQREYVRSAMAEQREYVRAAMAEQREYFRSELAEQREYLHGKLAEQREYVHGALADTRLDLHKAMMSHLWKLYGFASLMLAGVYYIARYVH